MGGKGEMRDREVAAKYRIEDCRRCKNECATACPIYRHYGTYHPQQLAHLFLEGGEKGAHDHRLIWSCVTCKACTEACPFKVEFADFIRELRVGRTDFEAVFGGLIRAYQRSQAESTSARASGASLAWLDDSLDVNRSGDVLLFVGCLPLFDSVLGAPGERRFTDMARSAVKLLNRLGVSPIVLTDERCCGRDLFDVGDRDAFHALARHNLEAIEKSRAKTVVTICPECAFTLRETYATGLGDLPFEVPFAVRHISEFITERLGSFAFERNGEKLALHDPCYLCRYLDAGDAPRKLLGALVLGQPVELERRGAAAPCCGAGSWVNHGPHTRTAVNERLTEAHRCGAEALVTACPKCTLLYEEVMPERSWRQSPIVVKDLITLAAARLK
jgi:heterodisulfide reductase subunit D